MKTFDYTIKDSIGIHARPAGLLAKTAKSFKSEIILEKGEKSVNATKIMQLMGMGIKCGDKVKIKVTGEDEEQAVAEIKRFFVENL